MLTGKSLRHLVALAIALVAVPTLARADITSGLWGLDQSNTYADGITYGTVAIVADDSTGVVEFTVDAFDLQPLYGTLSNFGIQSFGFNFEHITSSPDLWDVTLPTGWTQDSSGGNMDGFGSFLVTESGTGGYRQDPLSFSLELPTVSEAIVDNFTVLSTGNPAQGAFFFSAHVAGYENGPGSHYIGGSQVVPVPGAGVLAALGLGLVGWVKSRRR